MGGATRRVEAVSGESPQQSERLVDLKDAGFAQSHGERATSGNRRKEEAVWSCVVQERYLGGPWYASQVDHGRRRQESGSGAGFVEMGSVKKPRP